MKVESVSVERYSAYLKEEGLRYFLNQSPAFGLQKSSEGNRVDYLLFKDEDSQGYVGSALVVYYQYKKIFRMAQVLYGPSIPVKHLNLLEDILKALKKYVFSSWRVQILKINPLFPKYIYQDIERIKEASVQEEASLKKLGFKRLEKEWYEDASIPLRCIYSRILEPRNFEDFLETLDIGLKQSIKKANDMQVKVRMLERQELGIFNEMLQETLDSKDSVVRVRPEQNLAFFDYFKEDIYFPLAYIDVKETLKTYAEQKHILIQKQSELDQKYENHEHKKYKNLSRDLEDQRKRLEKLSFVLENLKVDELPLASSCFIASGQDFIHFLAGAPKKYMQYQGMAAIHNHMINIALKRGYRYYNLYGCSDQLNEEDIHFGLIQFKRNFKGNFEEFLGTYVFKRSFI